MHDHREAERERGCDFRSGSRRVDVGLCKELKRRLIEKALCAELTDHLGYEKNDPAGRGSGNSCNGHSTKR